MWDSSSRGAHPRAYRLDRKYNTQLYHVRVYTILSHDIVRRTAACIQIKTLIPMINQQNRFYRDILGRYTMCIHTTHVTLLYRHVYHARFSFRFFHFELNWIFPRQIIIRHRSRARAPVYDDGDFIHPFKFVMKLIKRVISTVRVISVYLFRKVFAFNIRILYCFN